MCIQDIQIARATRSYRRKVHLLASAVEALPANPQRYAIVLPVPISDIYQWWLGIASETAQGTPDFITGTGLGLSNTSDIAVNGMVLTLMELGDAIRRPLTLLSVNLLQQDAYVTEVEFTTEIPPLVIGI